MPGLARSVSSATSAAPKLHHARDSVQVLTGIPVVLLPLAGLEVGEPVTPALEPLDAVVGTVVSWLEQQSCIVHAHLNDERGHRLALLAPQGGHSLVGGKVGSPEVWPRWRQAR